MICVGNYCKYLHRRFTLVATNFKCAAADNIFERKKSLKMNSEIKFHLRVLEFSEEVLPKMKELRKRYIRLSLLRQPDKAGTDAAFKELLEAYKFIGNLIEKEKCDELDKDEQRARREYKENNFEKNK